MENYYRIESSPVSTCGILNSNLKTGCPKRENLHFLHGTPTVNGDLKFPDSRNYRREMDRAFPFFFTGESDKLNSRGITGYGTEADPDITEAGLETSAGRKIATGKLSGCQEFFNFKKRNFREIPRPSGNWNIRIQITVENGTNVNLQPRSVMARSWIKVEIQIQFPTEHRARIRTPRCDKRGNKSGICQLTVLKCREPFGLSRCPG